MFYKPEILVPGEMSNVRGVTGDQIVDCDDAMTFSQQLISQVRAQKASAAGHDRNGILGAYWHCGSI